LSFIVGNAIEGLYRRLERRAAWCSGAVVQCRVDAHFVEDGLGACHDLLAVRDRLLCNLHVHL